MSEPSMSMCLRGSASTPKMVAASASMRLDTLTGLNSCVVMWCSRSRSHAVIAQTPHHRRTHRHVRASGYSVEGLGALSGSVVGQFAVGDAYSGRYPGEQAEQRLTFSGG